MFLMLMNLLQRRLLEWVRLVLRRKGLNILELRMMKS